MKLWLFLALLAFFFLNYSNADAQNSTEPYRLLWTEVFPSSQNGAELLLWWLKFHPSGFVWDLFVSTEGWGEVDAGFGVVKGNWVFVGMSGLDFPLASSKVSNFMPQIYIIYWDKRKRMRFQSWNMIFLSLVQGGGMRWRVRNFSTFKGVGFDIDCNGGSSNTTIFIGPMLEAEFNPGRILLGLRRDLISGGREVRLTYFMEW